MQHKNPHTIHKDTAKIDTHPASADNYPNHEENFHMNDVKTLLEWTAASRPYKKRQKAYYVNILLLTGTILIILFLFSQYALMLVVISIAFVSFALASTPPQNNHYSISTEGIAMDDHFYLWQELYDFYFKKRFGEDILHIRTKNYFPGELIMMLGGISKERMRVTLISFLPFREVVRSSYSERAGDWLLKTFPLDDAHSS